MKEKKKEWVGMRMNKLAVYELQDYNFYEAVYVISSLPL